MTMKDFKHLIGNDLEWAQGSGRKFDLCSGNESFGHLVFRSVFGSTATADCAEGQFTFKRQGFLRPWISIRRMGIEIDLGRVDMDPWRHGGQIVLGGRQYQFFKEGFLHPEWSVLGEGRQLMRISVCWGLLRYKGTVHIEPFGKDDLSLPLICLICLYAIILMNDEAAAATVATTT